MCPPSRPTRLPAGPAQQGPPQMLQAGKSRGDHVPGGGAGHCMPSYPPTPLMGLSASGRRKGRTGGRILTNSLPRDSAGTPQAQDECYVQGLICSRVSVSSCTPIWRTGRVPGCKWGSATGGGAQPDPVLVSETRVYISKCITHERV